jgi:hypothetical protein
MGRRAGRTHLMKRLVRSGVVSKYSVVETEGDGNVRDLIDEMTRSSGYRMTLQGSVCGERLLVWWAGSILCFFCSELRGTSLLDLTLRDIQAWNIGQFLGAV